MEHDKKYFEWCDGDRQYYNVDSYVLRMLIGKNSGRNLALVSSLKLWAALEDDLAKLGRKDGFYTE